MIAIHINPAQVHQQEIGSWILAGFNRQGMEAKITYNPNETADVHVVYGPWFAKRHWLDHPHVLLIDRSYYNQVNSGRWTSEDWVSIGWMNKHGYFSFVTFVIFYDVL
jgi:hypothetical protein